MTEETRDLLEDAAPGPAAPGPVPRAHVGRDRAASWIWLVPLIAVGLAALLLSRALAERGPTISVRFDQGYGIKAGDPVRHLGITVGRIEGVQATPELDAVLCRILLDQASQGLARAGTRFWIVRPHVSLDGVGGLETLVGARYIAATPVVAPEQAEEQFEFRGLDTPPLLERVEPGGLEIVLNAPRRFGLLPGAPLYYRQIQVGSVVDVSLSSDATTVEVRAYLRAAFAPLVRRNTRFWQVTGIDMRLALTEGFSFELESLRTLISGGVALATPNDPGPSVQNGHVFLLRESYDDEWLEWRPAIPIGSTLLPEGAPMPRPSRAVLRWVAGRFLKTDEERRGNMLQLAQGLLAPADMLRPPAESIAGSARLEVAGEGLALDRELLWQHDGLALVDVRLSGREPWPAERVRAMAEPEDCLVVAEGLAPQALSAARFSEQDSGWRVEKMLTFESRWHGASVVARSDGQLVGVLLLDGDRGSVVPVLVE